MAKQQRLVRFSGMVQGVGFRYTARQAAGDYDVTGYVRNLDDGRVEVLVEGEEDQVNLFLEDLRDRMGRYIQKTTQEIGLYSGRYEDFRVAF